MGRGWVTVMTMKDRVDVGLGSSVTRVVTMGGSSVSLVAMTLRVGFTVGDGEAVSTSVRMAASVLLADGSGLFTP